ncbi:hypothetical protein LZ30DRAFT_312800 [Colletotrichum cereale]|nr:hypothetical protein LZ30DRAFT_312800 [Colletotrichum cereale]
MWEPHAWNVSTSSLSHFHGDGTLASKQADSATGQVSELNSYKTFDVNQFGALCPCKHVDLTPKIQRKSETEYSRRAGLFLWSSTPRSTDRTSRRGASQGSSARQAILLFPNFDHDLDLLTRRCFGRQQRLCLSSSSFLAGGRSSVGRKKIETTAGG